MRIQNSLRAKLQKHIMFGCILQLQIIMQQEKDGASFEDDGEKSRTLLWNVWPARKQNTKRKLMMIIEVSPGRRRVGGVRAGGGARGRRCAVGSVASQRQTCAQATAPLAAVRRRLCARAAACGHRRAGTQTGVRIGALLLSSLAN